MRIDTRDILRDDIGAVPLDRNAVVSAFNGPVVQEHILRVPGISAIGVDGKPGVVACCSHVDVGEGHIPRM